MEIITKGRKHLLVRCDQFHLSSLIINITWRKPVTSWIFCIKIIIKRLPLLVGCDQLCFFSNPIVGFFDHQYLWKEILCICYFEILFIMFSSILLFLKVDVFLWTAVSAYVRPCHKKILPLLKIHNTKWCKN